MENRARDWQWRSGPAWPKWSAVRPLRPVTDRAQDAQPVQSGGLCPSAHGASLRPCPGALIGWAGREVLLERSPPRYLCCCGVVGGRGAGCCRGVSGRSCLGSAMSDPAQQPASAVPEGEAPGGGPPEPPPNLTSNRRLQQTEAQVQEVVDLMRVNVDKVLERDQILSQLDDRADALQAGASQFESSAAKLKRKYWWKNCKMMIMMGVIGAIVVMVIASKY
ncbi:vesicle-associated membrane protein 1 [Indicator indicator]|uniref:vesicle-associated membrane protein 1 n=1 Tax=Indicator indicator TaxID=1002788 RepID=UPI0023DF4BCB|nr:vesicle-associated membrane protein 1 [Indicator indicator]